jgi:hypothetical protein
MCQKYTHTHTHTHTSTTHCYSENTTAMTHLKSRGKITRSHFENLSFLWRITLRWIIKLYDGKAWTHFICLEMGQFLSFYEDCNVTSGSIKCRKFAYSK